MQPVAATRPSDPETGAPDAADRARKRAAVHELLDRHGAESVVLRSAAAVTWYLDGARAHVSLAADPIVTVRVTRDRDEVRVTDNETGRLVAEELPADVSIVERPWFQALDDAGALDESAVDGELRSLRRVLLPAESRRFRSLGQDAAAVLTAVLRAADPSDTERSIAARVAGEVVARGADPVVVLVAGASRLGFRHPLPTDAPLGRRAMVVLCARRHGLIANVTRWVGFDGGDSAERRADQERQQRILEVEATAFRATVPGRSLGEVLVDIERAYADHGFGPEEWRAHHQGGAAGYAGRDPRATPGARDTVALGQAFAWNPSAPGAKVEDTVLLGSAGVEALTVDPAWPTTVVDGRPRPVQLER
nr:M24 family metallopeptidase [Plantibacter sp. ME-Dv--P-122b]